MIITKSGKNLYAEFICKICECEYSAPLKECEVMPIFDYDSRCDLDESLPLLGASARRECPCCGFKENICAMKHFKEYTEYPKDSESDDSESAGTVGTPVDS